MYSVWGPSTSFSAEYACELEGRCAEEDPTESAEGQQLASVIKNKQLQRNRQSASINKDMLSS